MTIRDGQQNVVQANCCIIDSTGKGCGTTVDIIHSSPKVCWNHLKKFHYRWQITTDITDIGSGQNKAGNVGLSPDVCDPEQICNWQERGWIRHHPRPPDKDVLVWWRDVGQARFPRITVMDRQFLAIPAAIATGPNGGLQVFLLVEVIFT